MKTKFLIVFLVFNCAVISAQTIQSLKADVHKLYTSFDDIDLEAVASALCSDKSADDVYKILDAYFLNDDNKFRYVYTNAKHNFSPFMVDDGKTYCVITFRNVIRITYFKPIDVASVQKSLKEQFNAQTIAYDKKRNAYLIVYNATMVAMSDGGVWKYMFADNTLPRQISENCKVPPAIKKELGL